VSEGLIADYTGLLADGKTLPGGIAAPE